ncbi:zinc-ribbon domain-containing protein [Halioglobus maricola]|uniref:Zinc-ribbon domain-containing protein n=1 Tax=Halioglobus maricola TaxID=2601894 RepID=A0A5P9NIH5_9GAMM|nr:zinc-ribbon domain-containing protein [Halioglobus maricola]
MARLIKCPDCGQKVSKRAQACPSCGYHVAKYRGQNQAFKVLMWLILIGIFASYLQGG